MMTMPLEKSPLHKPVGLLAELADQCVQCGLCLPVCPTYALDRTEAESPRGRIAIASALARGLAEPTRELRQHLDHCLGCLNCEKVCPAHVRYDELLIETRKLIGPAPQRPRALTAMISRPRWYRALRQLGRLTGLSRWKDGLARRLPAGSPWRAALLSLPSDLPASAVTAPTEQAANRIALFPGCVASVEDAAAQQAALTLLRAAGFAVDVLPSFCCGAMDLHAGAMADAAEQRIRLAWKQSGASRLVSVTPGCLGTLKRALPGVEVDDPLALLAERAGLLQFKPLQQQVAVHLPCTQINVAGTDADLLQLLGRIPQLDVRPLSRPPHCCGAAGSHMLEYPLRARALRDATLEQPAVREASQLVSSNIGCRLHLASGIREQGLKLPTQHPLTLLAQQLDHAG